MKEAEIRGRVMTLAGAVANNDEGAAMSAGIQLLAQALVDLNRIAEALEHLAKK